MKKTTKLLFIFLILCMPVTHQISGIANDNLPLSDVITDDVTYITSGNLRFGLVEIGYSKTMDFSITNTSNTKLIITDIELPFCFSTNWSSGEIEAGGTKTIQITFTPPTQRSYSGQILILSNGSLSGDTPYVSGKGIIIYK